MRVIRAVIRPYGQDPMNNWLWSYWWFRWPMAHRAAWQLE